MRCLLDGTHAKRLLTSTCACSGRPFIASLEGNVYCCNICAAHLAIQGDLLSKARLCISPNCLAIRPPQASSTNLPWHSLQSFHSRSGKAFLFNAVSNCIEGRIEERVMTTGEPLHTLACTCFGLSAEGH